MKPGKDKKMTSNGLKLKEEVDKDGKRGVQKQSYLSPSSTSLQDCSKSCWRLIRFDQPDLSHSWNMDENGIDISTLTSHVNQNAVLFELGASVTMPTAADWNLKYVFI